MSTRAKKTTELSSATSIANTDLFIVADVSANTTKSATMTVLSKSIVAGPFADDTAASAANVAIGQLYHTASGDVKVRVT